MDGDKGLRVGMRSNSRQFAAARRWLDKYVLTWSQDMSGQKIDKTRSEPSASDRFDWAINPRRSELDPGVYVKDPFDRGDRPGLGGSIDQRKGK